MSSKGRNRNPENISEFFATPRWCTHRFIEACDLPDGTWLEPCAGNGDLIRGVNEIRPRNITWHANEIRPECAAALAPFSNNITFSNFLEWETSHRFDVIITNPPFSLAFQIIKKSLELADYVVMLVRLNFIGSAKRTAFFKEFMPDIYVIPERPSFDGLGSDSIEYCFNVWSKPETRKRSKGFIELLGNTPKEVRRAHKPNLKFTEQMRLLQQTGRPEEDETLEEP